MAEWYVFALGTAVLITAATLVEKKTLLKEHAMEFSAVLGLFLALLSLVLLPKVSFGFSGGLWAMITLNGVVAAVAFLLFAKAVRHMEISLSSPLMSFTPAFTALIS